ncbi:hypothetical protein D9754_16435 [Planomicrobium sp. Y74]|nr:hypothetical protein D9754_16435 [Planomicrobium sp. Y74]
MGNRTSSKELCAGKVRLSPQDERQYVIDKLREAGLTVHETKKVPVDRVYSGPIGKLREQLKVNI